MARYRKRPVVISAIHYVDGYFEHELKQILKDNSWKFTANGLEITTLEGVMTAKKGDYIIRGIEGEAYPCKPDIFRKTYELVED